MPFSVSDDTFSDSESDQDDDDDDDFGKNSNCCCEFPGFIHCILQ